jgi:hypothetical protein
VYSPALPRIQLPVDDEKSDSVLSASQVKRLARKGARVFLAMIRPVESDSVPPVVASVAALSPDVPASSVQPDQPAGPPGGEVPWVSELLSEFSEAFQDPLPPGLPPERSEGHIISTEPGHPPPFRSMCHLSPLEYRELEKQVTKFLKDGILEVSQSPYGAPVLFVPKPNGRGLRLCVDYRALNSITVKNRCTIPRIDDLLDAVAGSAYFTSLDLTSGYHQILISEEDRPKTAFRTPFGHFQFKVLIEGLTNAPATFQSVMNSILHPYIMRFVVLYIDDILIFSKSEAEHQAHVRLVLEVLKRERFFVCKAKSSFAEPEVKYLGHIVDKQGICPDPKKVEAVQTWPAPKNVHDVRSFLGLVNYFRKFIEHYSEIAMPVTNSTKKSHPWVWTGCCQDQFHHVYTDHVSNTYFQTQPNLLRRQARWSELLQRFGAFEWKYRKGAKNVADALSRRDVAGSVWRFCRGAQLPVVGTAGAVATGHREAFQRISIPGQGEDVADD